jgi:peptide deformylase
MENNMDEIKVYPATVLRQRAKEVERFDSSVRSLVDRMTDIMYQADGVGLAAPQIGQSKRVIVIDVGEGPFSLVNPEIVEREEERESVEEGCLSLPGIRIDVTRPKAISVRGVDDKGETVVKTVEGMWARAFQHEIDHLNGVMIIDHASFVQKTLLKTKLKRLQD